MTIQKLVSKYETALQNTRAYQKETKDSVSQQLADQSVALLREILTDLKELQTEKNETAKK